MQRRRVMLAAGKRSRLPSGYQEVEYIQSQKSNPAYIDLGLAITINLRMDVIFQALSNRTGTYIFGQYQNNDGRFYLYNSTSYFQFAWACVYTNTSFPKDTAKHTASFFIENGKSNIIIDESSVTQQNVLPTMPQSNIIVAGTTRSSKEEVKTYKVTATLSNTPVRDLVPCYRKSDNKPGMFDLCGSICPLTNSPFYINAGTGEFLVGPDVN